MGLRMTSLCGPIVIKLRSLTMLKGCGFHLFQIDREFLPCVSRASVSALGEQPAISAINFFICHLSSDESLLGLEFFLFLNLV